MENDFFEQVIDANAPVEDEFYDFEIPEPLAEVVHSQQKIPVGGDRDTSYLENLARAEKELDSGDRFIGICKMCFDTGFVHVLKHNAWGVTYRKDESGNVLLIPCDHGTGVTGDYSF